MVKRSSRLKKIIWIAVGLVLVVALFCAWLYTGKLTQSKQAILQTFSLPIALVNGQAITMKNFVFKYSLAKKLFGQQELAKQDSEIKQKIFNQLIDEKELELFAVQKNLSINQRDLDNEYAAQAKAVNLEGKKSLSELLSSYGLNEVALKNQILKPQLLFIKLRVWYNSQESLNTQAYGRAGELVAEIKKGTDMGQLAANFSQDETGKSTKGDLGFVDIADLTPELKEPVAGLLIGEPEIIPSRQGLHIIRLEAKNGNKVQLRQIFLNTGDFESWWNSQKQTFKIYKLINF